MSSPPPAPRSLWRPKRAALLPREADKARRGHDKRLREPGKRRPEHDKLLREPAKWLNVPGRPPLEHDRRLPAPDGRLPLFAAVGKARPVHG